MLNSYRSSVVGAMSLNLTKQCFLFSSFVDLFHHLLLFIFLSFANYCTEVSNINLISVFRSVLNMHNIFSLLKRSSVDTMPL